MGSALKNTDGFTSLRSRGVSRQLLRAADVVHGRDAMTPRGAFRTGARLRMLAGTLLARQRAASAVADVIVLRPPAAPAARPRPLRVLRVVDDAAGSSAGRMVISGRMADVCAELDRLAAVSETRQAQRPPAAMRRVEKRSMN